MIAVSVVAALGAVALGAPLGMAQSGAAGGVTAPPTWTFAVSGDSRNCGDFVMPAIASRVKADGDAFYWHLGDFRWMSQPDEDITAMSGGNALTLSAYPEVAWDDFLAHQIAPFGDLPVFLGRGNHEAIPPMTRDRYVAKFSAFLNRPEILAQNKADKYGAAPKSSPWFHFVKNGVDFITLDNSTVDEFSYAQQTWLRGVLQRDEADGSGVTTIIAGMHEAMPHSFSASHAMDDSVWGTESGEKVYRWFADAQAAGKHVYLVASHSHYFSPALYDTPYWRKAGAVVPGVLIGLAGAHRYLLPDAHPAEAVEHQYGFLQGTVKADGSIDFAFRQIDEQQMKAHAWPQATTAAIEDCVQNNSDVRK